jgi:hypothetical protein
VFKLCVFLSVLFLAGCTKIEFSPNQKFDRNSSVDINQKNLDRLFNTVNDDTLRFVLSGDSQRSYDNVADFVNVVNSIKGLDLVILDGDISDFGLLQEMEWIHAMYGKLKAPYIGVIGNHDLQAKGKDVFQRMYGKLNYSFVYDSIKFVCHDTNSREYNFNGTAPDLAWLRNEFQPESKIKAFISVAHVPPFAADFDVDAQHAYLNILSSVNVLGSLYAHINETNTYYYTADESYYIDNEQPYHENEVPFLVTNALQNREFLIMEIVDGKLSSKNIKY